MIGAERAEAVKKSSARNQRALTAAVALGLIGTAAGVTFIVAGDSEENELILVAVLDALVDSLSSLLKGMVEKRTVLHQLELGADSDQDVLMVDRKSVV